MRNVTMTRVVGAVAAMMFSACGGPSDSSGDGPGGYCTEDRGCQAFTCACSDGTVLSASRCLNNTCQSAATTCSGVCKNNGGGGGSGGTGGGGGSEGGGGGRAGGSGGGGGSGLTCSSGDTCAAYACTCPDGTRWNSARYCYNQVCQGQAATCGNACKDHQQATPQVYGCTLSRYSTDYSVSTQMYGSDATRGGALNDAMTQCAAANWTSTFCSSASESCALENQVSYSCTFSKYASSQGSTIRFYGAGLGETAAKAATVDACLRSGQWKGWFCTSGSITCSAD